MTKTVCFFAHVFPPNFYEGHDLLLLQAAMISLGILRGGKFNASAVTFPYEKRKVKLMAVLSSVKNVILQGAFA